MQSRTHGVPARCRPGAGQVLANEAWVAKTPQRRRHGWLHTKSRRDENHHCLFFETKRDLASIIYGATTVRQ